MRAVEDAAVDADLVCADAILEPPPVDKHAGDEEDGDPREQQERAVAALRLKTEMLWAQLEAIERGDTQPEVAA